MSFLDRFLNLLFKIFCYSYYRRKYTLCKGFRFNGYLIRISGDGDVISGKNSYISYYSYVNVIKGTSVFLGHNVSIAHNVRIYTSSFDVEKFILSGQKVSVSADVVIGSNVLIGSNTFVCPGVTIGDNVVVGANSVVTKNIPSNCVAAGNPAKVIKEYTSDCQVMNGEAFAN